MTALSRRSFVRRAACGLAGLTTATFLSDSVRGANDKISVAAIGVRTQGMIMARSFIKTGRAEITAVCDVDGQILSERTKDIESLQKKAPRACADFRRVLEDKDIDAVIVATPDHWHAIMAIRACEAGKDVYLEKPCAHNVRECRLIAQAARKHGRIIQHGTMQRSGAHFQEAREYVRSGKLGKIGLIRCFSILGRASIGHKPNSQPPSGLDYDFWLGPAPKSPTTKTAATTTGALCGTTAPATWETGASTGWISRSGRWTWAGPMRSPVQGGNSSMTMTKKHPIPN